jgi:hypothetical protein
MTAWVVVARRALPALGTLPRGGGLACSGPRLGGTARGTVCRGVRVTVGAACRWSVSPPARRAGVPS